MCVFDPGQNYPCVFRAVICHIFERIIICIPWHYLCVSSSYRNVRYVHTPVSEDSLNFPVLTVVQRTVNSITEHR